MFCTGQPKNVARGDEHVGALQQLLAELRRAETGFFHTREEVECTARRHEREIIDGGKPLGRVENAVTVGADVFLTDPRALMQRGNGRTLRHRRRGIDERTVYAVHNVQQLWLRDDGTDAPAGHHVVFREAVECDGALFHAGQGTHGGVEALIEIRRVNFIRSDDQVIFLRDLSQNLQRITAIGHAGGIRGIIENNGLCARRNGGTQALGGDRVVLLLVCWYFHAHAAGQFDLAAIHGKIRRKDDHLITGVQNSEHDKRHAKTAGSGDKHVVMRQLLRKIFFPGFANCVDQLPVAARVAIVRVAGARVAEGGVQDGFVGGKIRVADAQVNDVIVSGQRLCVQCQSAASCLKAFCNVGRAHHMVPPVFFCSPL